MSDSTSIIDGFDADRLVPRKTSKEEAHFDITAMIDLVFMMNIFFLVTTVGAAMAEIDLPPAQHCSAADPSTSVIVTVVANAGDESVTIYVGERGTKGEPIGDEDLQVQGVQRAVEEGLRDGKHDVVFKAERKVRLRDMARLTTAASLEGVNLHLAVMEKD